MNHLIESRPFFGVNAPLFAWIAAGLLLLFAFLRRHRASYQECGDFVTLEIALQTALTGLRKPTFGSGLSLSDVEAILKGIRQLPSLRSKLGPDRAQTNQTQRDHQEMNIGSPPQLTDYPPNFGRLRHSAKSGNGTRQFPEF